MEIIFNLRTSQVTALTILVACVLQMTSHASGSLQTLYDIFEMADDIPDTDELPEARDQVKETKLGHRHGNSLHSDEDLPFELTDLGLFLQGKHKVKNVPCTKQVLEKCDLKSLAKLFQYGDSSPCELLQAYESCVSKQLKKCSDEDAELLKSSLEYLFAGYMLNGHCTNPNIDMRHALRDITELPMLCAPEKTLHCGKNLARYLADGTGVCSALHKFNHCIHKMTTDCPYHASRYLRDGARGLAKIYRRTHICPS